MEKAEKGEKGEKGENKWQRISWEDAFDEIAGKLKILKEKYGPETLVATHGTGRTNAHEPHR